MIPVRCPACGGRSRAVAAATVACPHCDTRFRAEPEPPVVRVIAPADAVPTFHPAAAAAKAGPTPALVGLALLPFAVPLLWLLGPLVAGRQPVFSFAVPFAVAVAASGLALGVAVTADWSAAARLRGVVGIGLCGFAAALFLFFVQKEWLEAARRQVKRDEHEWREYTPDDGVFVVRVPGRADRVPAAEPVPGWPLTAARCADPRDSADVYVVAHGPVPAEAKPLDNDAFFDAVRKKLAAAAGVEPTETAVGQQGHPGREYAFALPDNITNRTVRVFRAGPRVFYLAVDGAALTPSAPDARRFFESFYIKPGK